jgi:hypothetical protein
LPKRLEQLPQFVFGCVEAQIPHKNILHASASALSCRKCEQFGGLGRSGGPFLKIETGAGEQSNAGRSIAGLRKPACQLISGGSAADGPLALIDFPVTLRMESHLQQPVLGIVSLPASGTNEVAAPSRALMVVVLCYGECGPATARHQKHAESRFAFCAAFGFLGLTSLRRWRMNSSCACSTAGFSCAAAATWV